MQDREVMITNVQNIFVLLATNTRCSPGSRRSPYLKFKESKCKRLETTIGAALDWDLCRKEEKRCFSERESGGMRYDTPGPFNHFM